MTSPIDTYEVISAVNTVIAGTGVFDARLDHEPKSAPSIEGWTWACYVDRWIPLSSRSGLAATSMLLALKGRVYKSFIAQPEDDIDKDMLARVDAVHREFQRNLNLGFDRDTVGVELDLLGSVTTGLSTILGYINLDGKIFRVADTAIPIMVPTYYPQERSE